MSRPRMEPTPGARYHETFAQNYTRCGKAACHCMQGSQGHGPYWFAFWTDNRGRTRTRYIGKSLERDAERQRLKAEKKAREQEERRRREREQEEARQREWQRQRQHGRHAPPRQSQDEADASLLGVTPNVTQGELKKAFRKAALEHHPDRGGSHKRMTEINAAHERMKQRRGW